MPAYVNPHTSFFDKSFNETQTHAYILSIQLSLDGLVFSVYDTKKNKFIALESFRFSGLKTIDQIAGELDSVVSKREWLIQPFEKTYLLFTNPCNTLVPSALFSEAEKETYFQFNHDLKQNETVHFNPLDNAGIVNLFTIPNLLFHKIQALWPAIVINHFSSLLIESLLINHKNKAGEDTLFVQVHKDYFEMANLRNGRLFFHNLFKYNSKEDFIYFLLAAIELLKLNPETLKLILLGDIHKSSVYYEMIFRYVRNSEFIEKHDTFNYSYLLDKIAHHQFYVLFNTLQCES